MKILFVSRGSNNKPKIIVENQGKSLIDNGVNVDYFLINSNGFLGYIKAIKPLRKVLLREKYDTVHAHYSFSAIIASFARAKPLVVSLMGSDVKRNLIGRLTIVIFRLLFSWRAIITKSEDSKASLRINSIIIPNGVDFSLFKPYDKVMCQERIGWDSKFKHILFAADPDRVEKNYNLASAAFELLEKEDFKIHFLKSVPYAETVYWYNAADIVLLTSKWEGSPNVIKEAMACCRPIVSTNVGDVELILGDVSGCYLSSYKAEVLARRILDALDFSNREEKTKGRERIQKLGLDSSTVASRIIEVYNNVEVKTRK